LQIQEEAKGEYLLSYLYPFFPQIIKACKGRASFATNYQYRKKEKEKKGQTYL